MIFQPQGGAFILSEKIDFCTLCIIMPFLGAKYNGFCENLSNSVALLVAFTCKCLFIA
jgi:hypothetical protein